MTITAATKVQSHSKMAKQKNHKKHTKKGYDGSELQQSSAPNSPSRNLPRRRRRNMNMLSADDYKLRQEVERGGKLTIVDMESDGNCLFRSISDQLYYDYGNNHHEIRDDICNYIEDHKDDFIFFLVLDDKDAAENDEDATDFESYVANMRNDGDWGGQIELLAASRVYRRNITVYSSRLGKVTIEHESPKGSSGPDLLLSYHDNEHYNSIRVSSVTKPQPPIKYYVSSYNRATSMDEKEHIQETDSEMATDAKISDTITATVSPVTTPDVEMSETESTMGQDTSYKISTETTKEHYETLPIESEKHPDHFEQIPLLQTRNDQGLRGENVSSEITTASQTSNAVEMKLPSTSTEKFPMEGQIDAGKNVQMSCQNDAANSEGSTINKQIPVNCPNNSTETKNTQGALVDGNDVDTNSQTLVAADAISSEDSTDRPTMDGTFQVLQI